MPLVRNVLFAVLVAALLGGADAFWLERQHRQRQQRATEQTRRPGVEVRTLQRQTRCPAVRATLPQAEARLECAGPEDLKQGLTPGQDGATEVVGPFSYTEARREFEAALQEDGGRVVTDPDP